MLYGNQVGTFLPIGGEKRKNEYGEERTFDTEKVRISKDDIAYIKDAVSCMPDMKLMGFKDKDYLKPYHNFKKASLLVIPDDSRAAGSSVCFDALSKEMRRKDKIAIVMFRQSKVTQVRLCALLP